jgi:hypothetical protein
MTQADAAEMKQIRRDIDLPALVERAFATRLAQFGWFLAVALLTRVSVFGDLNYHNDELLFFLAGQRMHDGLLPYVDIWDRKGPGLFVIYYLITGVSRSVIAYQAVACLFAAATAQVANRIAERFAGRVGALFAGTLYLVMLPLFAGGGGQAAVFYNLFVALAALAVFTRLPQLHEGRIGAAEYGAMASAGFAITFKQTAMFEGTFLGCVVLWQLHRGGMPPGRLLTRTLGLILAGAAPMLAFAAVYAGIGHFPEFWHAMVTANLSKAYDPDGDAWPRIKAMAIIASPLLLPAVGTLLLPPKSKAVPRLFLGGWVVAALCGLAIIPNFIDHYMLPVLLPLAVVAAPTLDRRGLGPAYALTASIFALMAGPTLHFADRRASRETMEAIAADIRAMDPHPRLFVFEGPVHLYTMLGSYPPTPLIFPMHLSYPPERNTSYLDTAQELRRVLAWRPTVVVTGRVFPNTFNNPETMAMVAAYVARCRRHIVRPFVEYYGPSSITIHGDCASGASP